MVDLTEDSHLVLNTYIALEVLVTFSVVCRFWARLNKRAKILWDDIWMLIAWACWTAYVSIVIVVIKKGAAQIAITPIELTEIIDILKLNYAGGIVFETVNIASKMSLLLLYQRIFATKTFRKWSNWFLLFCVAWYLSSVLVTALQCLPVTQVWDPLVQSHMKPSNCVDLRAFVVGYEVGNMFCDIIILCFPVRMVMSLQLRLHQKVLINGIFLLGAFVVVASILRVKYIWSAADTRDYTINTILWSGISDASSVICANLPTLKPILPSSETLHKYITPLSTMFSSRGTKSSWSEISKSQATRDPAVRSQTSTSSLTRGKPEEMPPAWGYSSEPQVGRGDLRSEMPMYPLNSIRVNHTFDVSKTNGQ